MRKTLFVTSLALALAGTFGTPPANALPHGCVSASNDYSVGLDPHDRALAVRVNIDESCTFQFAPGDVFTGSGRFTVSCETGGYYHRPDLAKVEVLPIPQPCAPGAVVTVNAYHLGTGGAAFGGGIDFVPSGAGGNSANTDFKPMCAAGLTPSASVRLTPPVNYSGLLTFAGQVTCGGTDVTIASVRVTPLNDYPYPAAGPASCTNCTAALSVTGTIPAGFWIYEVAMDFNVTKAGVTVHGQRVGRYLATYGGSITALCPVAGAETCAA